MRATRAYVLGPILTTVIRTLTTFCGRCSRPFNSSLSTIGRTFITRFVHRFKTDAIYFFICTETKRLRILTNLTLSPIAIFLYRPDIVSIKDKSSIFTSVFSLGMNILLFTGVVGVRTYQRLVLHGGRVFRLILPHKSDARRSCTQLWGGSWNYERG